MSLKWKWIEEENFWFRLRTIDLEVDLEVALY